MKRNDLYYLGRTWGYETLLEGRTKKGITLYLHPWSDEFIINTICPTPR
jgi:hypothetical protein